MYGWKESIFHNADGDSDDDDDEDDDDNDDAEYDDDESVVGVPTNNHSFTILMVTL